MRTPQRPIHSGFNAASTASEVVRGLDLSGKFAIVTGGYSGIGLETARVLAEAGASVLVPARDPQRATRALAGLPRVSIDSLDLSEPSSIERFAVRFLERRQPLHILINSAGIMATPLLRDRRGYEMQFATNHLGHFQLSLQLWPALSAAAGARIVSVSSRAHRFSAVDMDDPNFLRRPYDKWLAYGQSKTANALFAIAADARGEVDGIRTFSVHPGAILTELSRHLTDEDLAGYGVSRATPHGYVPPGESAAEGGIFKTVPQGAATSVWCATSAQLEGQGGVYCEDVDIAEIAESATISERGVYPWAADAAAAETLWLLSEQLTGARLK